MTKTNQFPPGWDDIRVREVIGYYEGQTDEEAAAEHESALARADETLLPVPNALVPEVRKLIARHKRDQAA
ncbi:MAG TPA: hypothetical protein VN851_04860 [Thermoanaerobaculia bacterium]|nr:hypothetical protein [Thermoanaerobaculia bacterium]